MWSVIKRRAGFAQAASFNFNVVAIGIGHEGQRVDVSRFEIHRMDILTASAEHNAPYFAPDRGHRAHAAGLERGIKRSSPQVCIADAGTRFADCHDFGMGSGIMQFVALIALRRDQPAIKHYDGADRRTCGIAAFGSRDGNRLSHPEGIIDYRHG